MKLHRSSVREVVLKHGERAAGLVDLEDRGGRLRLREATRLPGWETVVDSGDRRQHGAHGELERDPAGGVSPGGRPNGPGGPSGGRRG